jgi:NADH/F420H2 dehydrogenase subunit C
MKQATLISTYLRTHYGLFITDLAFLDRDLVVTVPANQISAFLRALKDDEKLQFVQLLDLFAVDYPKSSQRFELNYSLLSVVNNVRLLLKSFPEKDWTHSVSSLYPSAVWLEREVWDMFGIFFYGHPDLRRILTDYGFEGYPLRKDFPLSGYSEVRYDEEKKKIVSEPLRLTQEFRYFDFVSPWVDEKHK